MSIHVQLERFEGPLGLLLHLIREQEMDIFNINIHQITTQYLEYIKAMRRLDLEVAGEFVAMAATLLHIKSRTLLPSYNEEGEEVVEDPRQGLVQKLLEYEKFKGLSADLYKLPLLGRDVWARGERTEVESATEGELVLEDNPLFSLIVAYRTAVKNMKKTVHRVFGELQSIASRILEMKELLVVGHRTIFRDLITDKENPSSQVLVTFLSLLELAKMGFVSLFQSEPLSDIHVEPKRVIDRDIVSQVESYDSVNAEQAAEAIMNEAQLSLNESVLSVEDETGEAPVVGEQDGDAATDEEIEAELRRLENPALDLEVAAVAESPTALVVATESAPLDEMVLGYAAPIEELTAAFESVIEEPAVATTDVAVEFEAAEFEQAAVVTDAYEFVADASIQEDFIEAVQPEGVQSAERLVSLESTESANVEESASVSVDAAVEASSETSNEISHEEIQVENPERDPEVPA